MNFGDFKVQVAAYVGRDINSFQVDGVDLLTLAINQARKYGESQCDFEFSKQEARLPAVTPAVGAPFSSIVDSNGDPVNVKGIQSAWVADANWVPVLPLDMYGRKEYQQRLARRSFRRFRSDGTLEPVVTDPVPPALVLHGTRLRLYPGDGSDMLPATVNVALDVVRWLDDYNDDADTDFFLVEGNTWLTFRSVIHLNYFLKEDQRVAIQAAAVDDAWRSLLRWNAGLVTLRVDTVNLD